MIPKNSTILFQGDSITDCGRNRDAAGTPNTKSSLLLDFGRGAQASRLCASSCCLGSMNASTLISLHTAETAMPPSCAMQSPISKRHWYNDLCGLGRGYAMMAAAQLLSTRPADGLRVFNRGISGNRVVDLYARNAKTCHLVNLAARRLRLPSQA